MADHLGGGLRTAGDPALIFFHKDGVKGFKSGSGMGLSGNTSPVTVGWR